jgi:hypothetical protein
VFAEGSCECTIVSLTRLSAAVERFDDFDRLETGEVNVEISLPTWSSNLSSETLKQVAV